MASNGQFGQGVQVNSSWKLLKKEIARFVQQLDMAKFIEDPPPPERLEKALLDGVYLYFAKMQMYPFGESRFDVSTILSSGNRASIEQMFSSSIWDHEIVDHLCGDSTVANFLQGIFITFDGHRHAIGEVLFSDPDDAEEIGVKFRMHLFRAVVD